MVLTAALLQGCALAPNLPFLIVFQFLSGTAASVATANVAGTVADLFGDSDGAGQPSEHLRRETRLKHESDIE